MIENTRQKQKYIQVAEKIADKLCTSAYWHDLRCNWIGKSTEETMPMITTTYNKALSSEVYDGTSGIGLFLSNLYIHKKNDNYYRTSEGAINQALSQVDNIPNNSRFGFYSGILGVIYVAIEIGKNLKNNILIETGLNHLEKLYRDLNNEHLLDIISGNASGIPILLILYNFFKDERMLELAILLGNDLIDKAIKESYGWSWDSISNGVISCSNNLTGFSHGSAGMGYSLLELYHKTKEIKFLDSAGNAFSYENYWFNKEKNNWPDFRTDERNPNTNVTYAVTWCHGAPGIGLSRIRANCILKEEKYLVDSKAAIDTSSKILTLLVDSTFDRNNAYDFSLCHGISGICETILYANKIFKENSYQSIIDKVGNFGIENYMISGAKWPCGIKEGETPGLMLGLSGIGNFYLQLYDPTIINPLILLPE